MFYSCKNQCWADHQQSSSSSSARELCAIGIMICTYYHWWWSKDTNILYNMVIFHITSLQFNKHDGIKHRKKQSCIDLMMMDTRFFLCVCRQRRRNSQVCLLVVHMLPCLIIACDHKWWWLLLRFHIRFTNYSFSLPINLQKTTTSTAQPILLFTTIATSPHCA